MPHPRMTPTPCAYLGMLACTLLLFTAGGVRQAPAAEASPRQSKVCLDCHTGKDSTLVGTPHQLSGAEGAAGRVACTDCHGADRRHWEDDPARNPMTRPAQLHADAEARLCAACHQTAHQQEMREANVHLANDVNCSACHSVHQSTHPPLLKAAESGLCLGCHQDAAGQFARPYRHPVSDGVLRCSDCHVTHGATAQRLSRSPGETCTRCHAEMQGPFPFEHPATMSFSTEEGGCLTCHEPHGSALPRMLKQPYEAPLFPLCSQCHSVPGHNSNPMHGTRWAGVPCSDCHADIHGSYVSRLFLTESLRNQGCFNVGCHHF